MSWVRNPLAAPKFSLPYPGSRDPRALPRASKSTPDAAPVLPLSPSNLFAGTSGWAYASWKPKFYPAGVPARRFLRFYSTQLTSVEVNYTFSKLPTALQLHDWLDATPPGFLFTFKAPQRITHFQRLRDSEEALAEFLAAITPARAAGKLGALLFQLPPNFKPDPDRLSTFLSLPAFRKTPSRVAFEFRHAGWFADPVYDILRRHNAALCIAESDDLQTPDIATADFRYYRLRRNGGYTAAKVKAFAASFTGLARKQPVFAYFKHEEEPTGALNATALLRAAVASAKKPKGGPR
jgi:uncharacterized protein YecE (DUF72 family)